MIATPRPVTAADEPALLALVRREETHWFGAPETDEAELREYIALTDDLERDSLLVADGDGAPVAAGWLWGEREALLAVDPLQAKAQRLAAYDVLLGWLGGRDAQRVDALRQDDERLAALADRGWKPWISEFELLRPPQAPPLPEPSWPAGILVSGLDVQAHGRAVHEMLYSRSGWTDVPGHNDRPYGVWQRVLVHDGYDPDQQVVAWSGDRVAGVAVGRTFSDGTGWVQWLAVDRRDQGRGLGRALLVEALRRRERSGARQVGLGVSAGNELALGLYTSVGLEVEREWVKHRPGPRASGQGSRAT